MAASKNVNVKLDETTAVKVTIGEVTSRDREKMTKTSELLLNGEVIGQLTEIATGHDRYYTTTDNEGRTRATRVSRLKALKALLAN